MSRQGFAALAHCVESDDAALDDLIIYATVSLCDPAGLSALVAAAYAELEMDVTQAALDRLTDAGLVRLYLNSTYISAS